MIGSYHDKATEKVAAGNYSPRIPKDIRRRAKMRLDRITAAVRLEDLRVPSSHELEALEGRRRGQHSIGINDQWRICFRWKDGNGYEVEIADYHK